MKTLKSEQEFKDSIEKDCFFISVWVKADEEKGIEGVLETLRACGKDLGIPESQIEAIRYVRKWAARLRGPSVRVELKKLRSVSGHGRCRTKPTRGQLLREYASSLASE